MSLGMLEGACKYGSHNYRHAGVKASTYFDATILRHMGRWWEGEDIDAASGLNHIIKAMSSLHVLADAILQGNLIDDRPIRAHNQNWCEEQNAEAARIIAKYPNPVPRFTQLKQDPPPEPPLMVPPEEVTTFVPPSSKPPEWFSTAAPDARRFIPYRAQLECVNSRAFSDLNGLDDVMEEAMRMHVRRFRLDYYAKK
jgi:hypothetical protein